MTQKEDCRGYALQKELLGNRRLIINNFDFDWYDHIPYYVRSQPSSLFKNLARVMQQSSPVQESSIPTRAEINGLPRRSVRVALSGWKTLEQRLSPGGSDATATLVNVPFDQHSYLDHFISPPNQDMEAAIGTALNAIGQ